jgi:hypothetical protein
MSAQLAESNYIGELGDGLIRRWSTQADQPEIGHLMATVFRNSQDDPLHPSEVDQSRLMMGPDFPFMGPGDFAVVEDTRRQEHSIVACTCLFRHQWSYAGIPFGVGRPEQVATDPDYRNRGLVRVLFEMVHARSTAEGHLAQAITGIPYFYRQFGYEFVLDLGGARFIPVAAIPEKKDDGPELYSLRPATLDDSPHLHALYNQRRSASLVWHADSPEYWRFQTTVWDDPLMRDRDLTHVGLSRRFYMIVDGAGEVCGYTWLSIRRWGAIHHVARLELAPHVNWQAACPSLLRSLRKIGETIPAASPDVGPLNEIGFSLGRSHPFYEVLGKKLACRQDPPYAWYLRVPDVPAFIQHIAPILEERLANSVLIGYTGELKFDFYRGGLRLQFEEGKLTQIEPWRAPTFGDNAQAGCPPLVFLQLLFCYRSLAELSAIHPDVWANEDATLLINTLFPVTPSRVQPLG